MRLDDIARPALKPLSLALAAALIIAAPNVGAQVYKWVDERGVVNYGNNPPSEARGGKRATRVEDNLSVYTPDDPLLEATKRERERSAQRVPSARDSTLQPPARPGVPATTVARPGADAPCVSGFEPSCAGYVNYGPPVVHGHGGGPRLNQPELPPGTIAGNANSGTGYTPGLSTQPAPVSETTGRRVTPSASFTLKDIDGRGQGRR